MVSFDIFVGSVPNQTAEFGDLTAAGEGGGQLISNDTNTTAGQAVLGVVNLVDGSNLGFTAPNGYSTIDAERGVSSDAACMMSALSVSGGTPETFNVTYNAAFKAATIGGVVLS